MALSQKAWIRTGIGARLLMIAVLAASVPLTVNNDTWGGRGRFNKFYKLQSYSFAVALAVLAMVAGVLQIPVAVYLFCMNNRMTFIVGLKILDISLCTDVVVTILLASGVGAGFGATNDALRYVRYVGWDENHDMWRRYEFITEDELVDYYNRAIVPVVLLLLGTLLSMTATVVSARFRARATDDDDI